MLAYKSQQRAVPPQVIKPPNTERQYWVHDFCVLSVSCDSEYKCYLSVGVMH